ncbi:Uncharacterised protein [Vibrio cholerae]|nr:Uncharacterised protein [Vibrio cholerae]
MVIPIKSATLACPTPRVFGQNSYHWDTRNPRFHLVGRRRSLLAYQQDREIAFLTVHGAHLTQSEPVRALSLNGFCLTRSVVKTHH